MNEKLVQDGFNYQILNPEYRLFIQETTQELKSRLQRTALDIWEIGRKLSQVRSRLQHGQFEAWLRAEFGWSRRTAYNFINVYSTFSERAKFAQFNIATSALYLLASPSTPATVREKFIEKAKKGERVTHQEIRKLLSHTEPNLVGDSASKAKAAVTVPAVEVNHFTVAETPPTPTVNHPNYANATSNNESHWYLLEGQHLLFWGDTTSPSFVNRLPTAAIGFGFSSEDWHHSWLISKAKAVFILQQSVVLDEKLIERLLLMFSKCGDAVIFPWLPSGEIISTVHNLKRLIYTGSPILEHCTQAISKSGLRAERVNLP